MLRAYLDESGTHKGSPVCTIAGYMGSVKRWDEFERKWKAILDGERINEFHAKRFWARTHGGERVDEYKGWADEQAQRFLSRLLNIFERTDIYPFGAGIIVNEWEKLSLEQRRWLTGAEYLKGREEFTTSGSPTKPYFVPFHTCVFIPAKYCKSNLKVHFVADANEHLESWALRVFQDLKTRTEFGERLGDFTFSDSRAACGLQAADLLAYLSYQYGCQELKTSRPRPRIELTKALTKMRSEDDFKLLDKKGLELLLESFRSTFPKSGL
jgi:hypothetical protein